MFVSDVYLVAVRRLRGEVHVIRKSASEFHEVLLVQEPGQLDLWYAMELRVGAPRVFHGPWAIGNRSLCE